MNWKKLEALYAEAFETGSKEKAPACVEMVLDELRQEED
jgi:hypothetical protein